MLWTFFAYKFGKLDGMNQFVERYNLSNLMQEEADNL